jgi:glycosyltransferase involved in cell wall biosynthesis
VTRRRNGRTSRGSLAGRRIIFVLNWAVLGGAERQAIQLARGLRERGAVVEVCALTAKDGEGRRLCEQMGIPWHPVPIDWLWFSGRLRKARELVQVAAGLRRTRPDVLFPFCGFPNVVCGLVWRTTGAKLCVWHQEDVNELGRVHDSRIRWAVRSTPLFVANARHAGDFLVARWGAPRDRVRVIHEGVEPAAPAADRAAWRADLAIAEGDFAACMIAHLHSGKDHATLLQAWRIVADRLAEQHRHGVLLLAGRPAGTEDALKALAFDLRLQDHVRFVGEVSDVAGLAAACDAGVLSSRAEGCPNAVLESMAAGLAFAGTDIPGIREAVGQDSFPFLAPPGQVEPLAAALVRLAEDPELRSELGARNRERVQREFSMETMLERNEELLTAALVRP